MTQEDLPHQGKVGSHPVSNVLQIWLNAKHCTVLTDKYYKISNIIACFMYEFLNIHTMYSCACQLIYLIQMIRYSMDGIP